MTVVEEDDNNENYIVDYTKIPHELEEKYELLDTHSSLRPTIINIGIFFSFLVNCCGRLCPFNFAIVYM